jgi:hypothetical protein
MELRFPVKLPIRLRGCCPPVGGHRRPTACQAMVVDLIEATSSHASVYVYYLYIILIFRLLSVLVLSAKQHTSIIGVF